MEKLYKEMNNAEIRKISYEECLLKCTGCKALCNEMPVGQCRENLSQAFDNKYLEEEANDNNIKKQRYNY